MHALRNVLVVLAVMILIRSDNRMDEAPRLDRVVTASCPERSSPDLLSMPRQALPYGFVPIEVIRCRWIPQYLPGKGRWEVVNEEHANGPATELMTELRRPPERAQASPLLRLRWFFEGIRCPDIGYTFDYFVVVDSSGRAVLPDVPTSVCGKPFPSALDALDHLPYRLTKQLPVRRIESEKEFRAGCGHETRDLFLSFFKPESPLARRASARPLWNPAPQGLRVCVYRTSHKPTGINEATLESMRILKGSNLNTLLTALDNSPATDCPSHHTRFAVLDTGHRPAYAELDGCHNLMRPDETFGRLTPDAVALLTD
ncbi:hypothetical protein GCM10009530_02590 [Microbispora corallina]|uniref:Uncharacterized protein n=1 Tax=Microbispora corallina TaxID=83302 RepID=A0ABQ4FRS9_9ACTN|nr:hypothetical protein [Microbispora corallina]GIH37514.1 hypothetical protein Mco01_05140 [Microbispora corallina]